MKKKNKKLFIIIGVLLLIVIIVSGILILKSRNKKEENTQQPLITKVGNVSLEIKTAYDFTNGLAVIENDGKEYIIDQTGKFISDGYEKIYEYDNYYSMCNEDGCTVADSKGKKLFDLKQYDGIYITYDFFIAEKIDDDDTSRYALIDKKGELLTKFDYSDFVASKEYVFFQNDDNEYEAVNKDGKTKNIYDYDEMYGESYEGQSIIVINDDKAAIADEKGSLVTDYGYDDITLLAEKGPYLVVRDEKYGIIDEKGQKVIDANYDYIFNYADGYASVCDVKDDGEDVDDYSCGVMDKKGNKIIDFKYNYSYVFDDNHIIVGKANNDGIVYGLLDKNGKELLNIKYDYIYFTEDNHFVAIEDNKFSVYDNDLKKLFGDIEGNILYYNHGYFTIEKDRKCGFIDLSGNFVGKGIVYDEAGTFNDGLAPVKVGRYWGYINIEGKTIIGNIDEKFEEENKEDNQKVAVNIFYGNGCPHCAELEEWIESDEIQEKYGELFKINYYEVWYNASNKALAQEVANYLEKPFTGVPYIVIGDVVYNGFSSGIGMEDRILQTIEDEYNKKPSERIDVIAEVNGEN